MPVFDPKPFTVRYSDDAVADLRSRLKGTRFPDAVEGAGWDYGTNPQFLEKLVAHWADRFDFAAEEKRLNAFAQFTVEIDGETVHYVHARGNGGTRMPILLANGWPSNFVELLPLVPLLTETVDGQSYDVIIPSLPGFGFSGKAKKPGMNLTRVAELWARLMTGLGYERFLICGSDMGAGAEMGLVRAVPERVIGAHYVNVYSQYPRPEDPSEEEKAYFAKVDQWSFAEGAYAMIQATKPQTLAVGLTDSPAGLAAWIVEKFRTWGDTKGDVETVFPLDTLCAILTVYWVSATIGSSVRLYYEAFRDQAMMQPMPRHDVPHGIIVPPADLPAPRRWGERHLQNIVRWTELEKGGHFPSLEIPDVLADDIRAFHRAIENRG
ncbi:epoxide hydrolase [Devosia geojensis]|uniref:Epoxide hydrolase n=1 Tax=Devosia geojensis TaxID=443610 RepID=A0A0F5FPP6_9HYPH|nr:epoxide hydrolase family protein [Devosia geojensis]KKB10798.1 epoxide hydrolase [Devosia geojensis]